jgi:hypothetical protein
MALAAQDWLAKGGHSLTVGVLAANAPARGFYESLGARHVKDGTYRWGGFDLPDVIYVFDGLAALAANGAC